jgi:hypothetical protein
MKRIAYALLALSFMYFMKPAMAQNVVTSPSGVNSTNSSSTISVTNVFQSVFAASSSPNTGRKACMVQNTGSGTQYVYFGAIADATTPASQKLTAGQIAYCNLGGVVIRDQVSITGTGGDTFFAVQQ